MSYTGVYISCNLLAEHYVSCKSIPQLHIIQIKTGLAVLFLRVFLKKKMLIFFSN